jgi:hypothetical protein
MDHRRDRGHKTGPLVHLGHLPVSCLFRQIAVGNIPKSELPEIMVRLENVVVCTPELMVFCPQVRNRLAKKSQPSVYRLGPIYDDSKG